MTAPTPRRALLAVVLAAATAATVPGGRASAAGSGPEPAAPAGAAPPPAPAAPAPPVPDRTAATRKTVDNRFWYSYAHWRAGLHQGTTAIGGARPGLEIKTPAGRTEYADPHTGKKSTWEYATWTSPVHASTVPATEAIASWNARTPAGTWIQTELRGTYTDGTATPWYVMGRWASGDADIRRTSVDGQTDGKSTVWTDTLAVDAPASGLRIKDWRLRLTLYREPERSADRRCGWPAPWSRTSRTGSPSPRPPSPRPPPPPPPRPTS